MTDMVNEAQPETEVDIYAPPTPEDVERLVSELESGALDEARRQGRIEYNAKFPHRQVDVEYGLRPRPTDGEN